MIACISNTSLIAKLIFNYIPLKKHCSKLIFSGKSAPVWSDGTPTLVFDEIELDFASNPLPLRFLSTLDVSL